MDWKVDITAGMQIDPMAVPKSAPIAADVACQELADMLRGFRQGLHRAGGHGNLAQDEPSAVEIAQQ